VYNMYYIWRKRERFFSPFHVYSALLYSYWLLADAVEGSI
jgi:hypothetical protein